MAPSNTKDIGISKGLGVFSLALGASQIVKPDTVSRLVGIRPNRRNRALQRAVGVRELAAAAGLLRRATPTAWLFARATGDLMDIAMLRKASGRRRNNSKRVGFALGAVAGVAAVDAAATVRSRMRNTGREENGAMQANAAVTINRPVHEVYSRWKDFSTLPEFMYHLESVTKSGEGNWHWKAKAPAGRTVEWDARVVNDAPNEVIAWESLEGSGIDNSGAVRFREAPGNRGTEVRVELEYSPPAGAVGAAVAKLFGEEPQQQIRDDLRRFKQIMETGEVVVSDGTPDGTRTQRQFKQRDARPTTAEEDKS